MAALRGVAYLTGCALILTGCFDAVNRLTVDGWFLALVITGAAAIVFALSLDVETIPEGHSDQFGSLDRRERGL